MLFSARQSCACSLAGLETARILTAVAQLPHNIQRLLYLLCIMALRDHLVRTHVLRDHPSPETFAFPVSRLPLMTKVVGTRAITKSQSFECQMPTAVGCSGPQDAHNSVVKAHEVIALQGNKVCYSPSQSS